MQYWEAELHNYDQDNPDLDPDPDPDPDQDEAPPLTPPWHEVDHLIDDDDQWWQDLDPYGEEDPLWDPPLYDNHGLTADGFALLAEMDSKGDFI